VILGRVVAVAAAFQQGAKLDRVHRLVAVHRALAEPRRAECDRENDDGHGGEDEQRSPPATARGFDMAAPGRAGHSEGDDHFAGLPQTSTSVK
jgi:hypothetical protein